LHGASDVEDEIGPRHVHEFTRPRVAGQIDCVVFDAGSQTARAVSQASGRVLPGEQRRTWTGGVVAASHLSARSEEAVVIEHALPPLFARDVCEQFRIRSDLGSAEFRRVAAAGEVLMPVGDPLYGERER
jgi:hypothetical protein